MIKLIHSLIVKYLLSCGGAFHHNEYGENGRYIVIMNEEEYHKFQESKYCNKCNKCCFK